MVYLYKLWRFVCLLLYLEFFHFLAGGQQPVWGCPALLTPCCASIIISA